MEESFGQYVRGLRERAGVKLNEFAKQLDCKPRHNSLVGGEQSTKGSPTRLNNLLCHP